MKLAGATVFITGANRGIGLAFARHALALGAKTVYAGARDPKSVTLAGVVPVKLDVTNEADVAAAAALAGDTTILINNAGVAVPRSFLAEDAIAETRRELETNFYGPLFMTRAFAPVLAKNGGGAIVNVLSIVSFINNPMLGIYGATKTAAWGLTNSLRHDLRAQGTQVLAMHMAFVDTDLTKGFEAEKITPDFAVERTLAALEAGQEEVMVDPRTQMVHDNLTKSVYLLPPEAVRPPPVAKAA